MRKKLLLILSLLSLNLYGQNIYEEAIKDLRMEELVNTYSNEKVEKSLKGYKGKDNLKEKAVLVDLKAITVEDLNSKKNINKKLELFIEDYIDPKENYIGNISDKNIIERLNNKWSRGEVIEGSKLNSILNEAILKGLTTGYNIKDKKEYANFNEDYTVSYGHNDIIHASQIIGLLKGEKIDAKVQLEIKTSAFIYLPEWGESSYVTTRMPNGTIIAHPLEYDLKLQFDSQQDKDKFFKLIDKYAKKDEENQEGLLYESWWQPFIQTEKVAGYKMLIDNIVSDDKYDAHVLTLPEKSENLVKEVSKNKEIEIRTKEIWVNPAFYRFMLGQHK